MPAAFETLPDGTLKLDPQPERPAVLQVLIVGGGPAGTAVALRCKELGLQTLVVDRDDLMSRIRDYSKDKLIYPNYGGEDTLRFPQGGELIQELPFAPIDKDEICQGWKNLYVEHRIPAMIGVELMGTKREGEVWEALLYNHNTKEEAVFKAQHLVLAIGRGVPRTFDIPGNTMGVHYRLADADDFLGQPVCVVGGGTSAAEAVIALSGAKIKAGDATAVYWSYRGDKMPRVSKALNEEFFEAFVLNGNVRYLPRSEPAVVLTAEDHQEYLGIRVDRRRIEGRPAESLHLEFPKDSCVACIGEDIPEKFLAGMDIPMQSPGAGKKKMMVVDPILQTRQPGIYLIGDLISQYYLSTEDFDGSPEEFKRVRHPGNIKSALRDGVYIADVIASRLKGEDARSVRIIDLEEEPGDQRPFVSPVEGASDEELEGVTPVVDDAAWLTRLMPGGVEDARFGVKGKGVTTLGRANCDISLPDDPLISDNHASISRTPEGFLLRDDGSSNGVFLLLDPEGKREVVKGDLIALGRQFLLFGQDSSGKRFLSHYDAGGTEVQQYPLMEGDIVLVGRQSPDLTLDKGDVSLSRRHFKIWVEKERILVRDLFSSNGTALKVREALLEDGSRFRVGRNTFLFTLRERPGKRAAAQAKKPQPETAPEPAGEQMAQDQIVVTFKGSNETCPLAGRTILDAAEEAGLDLESSCRAGTCGIDPIRILEGGEYLNECSEDERSTLEENGLNCGTHRYACMARARGPVVVELGE